jgi:hypothetical protein
MTKLTNDKKIALTQAELTYLKSFLDAGDRPGFYYAYYAMVSEDTSYGQGGVNLKRNTARQLIERQRPVLRRPRLGS